MRQRPLHPALVEYCAADVAHLHAMRMAWGATVRDEEMREITRRRMQTAIRSQMTPKGQHMAVRDF